MQEVELPTPVSWRILVKAITIEEKSKGGILLSSEILKAENYLRRTGLVVKMGDLCYSHPDFKGRKQCSVGDYILHKEYTGVNIEIKTPDGKTESYRIINDDEVLATLTNPHTIRSYV